MKDYQGNVDNSNFIIVGGKKNSSSLLNSACGGKWIKLTKDKLIRGEEVNSYAYGIPQKK